MKNDGTGCFILIAAVLGIIVIAGFSIAGLR